MKSRSISQSWIGKALAIAMLGAMGSIAGGCAIHSTAPIKEVAYDFSDADFYDRDYAPSPNYEGEYQEYEVFVADDADADTPVFTIRQPTD
jgi:hypothetical protein